MGKDYEVGYCKPPKHTQFKKGVSGNAGGRTAGTRGIKTDLADELKAKHSIQIGGKTVTGTRQQLALRTLAIRAASGDLKAQQLLLTTVIQVLGIEDRGVAKEQLSAADQELLDELLAEGAGAADPDAAGSGEEDGGIVGEDGEDDGSVS